MERKCIIRSFYGAPTAQSSSFPLRFRFPASFGSCDPFTFLANMAPMAPGKPTLNHGSCESFVACMVFAFLAPVAPMASLLPASLLLFWLLCGSYGSHGSFVPRFVFAFLPPVAPMAPRTHCPMALLFPPSFPLCWLL